MSSAGNSSKVWLGGPLEKREIFLGEVAAQVSFPRRSHANSRFCPWKDESPTTGTLNARFEPFPLDPRFGFPQHHLLLMLSHHTTPTDLSGD